MLPCAFSGSMTTERRFYGSVSEMSEDDGKDEPPEVQEYVALAEADGFRPTSVEQGRQTVLRYARFLADQFATGLGRAGWEEYAAYKTHLAQTGISRATAQCYLSYLTGFYRLRAQVSLDSKLLDAYMKVRAIGVGRTLSQLLGGLAEILDRQGYSYVRERSEELLPISG